MVETALPRGYGENWIDGSSPRECDDEEDSVRPLPQDNGRKAEERRRESEKERQIRLNRKRREDEVRGKRQGEILAPLLAYRSLVSFASTWARDDLFSLVPSRAHSHPAFRSHTDTAGFIRVRLTYCLIIGPPRERRQSSIAMPRRSRHFSRRFGIATVMSVIRE